MIAFLIWIVGLVLTIKACLEIWNIPVNTPKKLLTIILLLLTSWLGLIIYYLVVKDKLADWLK